MPRLGGWIAFQNIAWGVDCASAPSGVTIAHNDNTRLLDNLRAFRISPGGVHNHTQNSTTTRACLTIFVSRTSRSSAVSAAAPPPPPPSGLGVGFLADDDAATDAPPPPLPISPDANDWPSFLRAATSAFLAALALAAAAAFSPPLGLAALRYRNVLGRVESSVEEVGAAVMRNGRLGVDVLRR